MLIWRERKLPSCAGKGWCIFSPLGTTTGKSHVYVFILWKMRGLSTIRIYTYNDLYAIHWICIGFDMGFNWDSCIHIDILGLMWFHVISCDFMWFHGNSQDFKGISQGFHLISREFIRFHLMVVHVISCGFI